MMAFLSPDSARHFKLILAKQFQDIDSKVSGLEGPDGSVLVTERNNAAHQSAQGSHRQGRQKHRHLLRRGAHERHVQEARGDGLQMESTPNGASRGT
jgi:hypothetical protein